MSNPYGLKVGDKLSMKLLIDGKPVAGEMVYASYNNIFGHNKDGSPRDAYKLLTNNEGIVTVKIRTTGHWYFRTVNLVRSTLKDADYVSISGALTFEVRE